MDGEAAAIALRGLRASSTGRGGECSWAIGPEEELCSWATGPDEDEQRLASTPTAGAPQFDGLAGSSSELSLLLGRVLLARSHI